MIAATYRLSTRTLATAFAVVLLGLLAATAISIVRMQGATLAADQRSAAHEQAAVQAEAVQLLSRERAEAIRALLAAPSAPARAASERRLTQITQDWQSGLRQLQGPELSPAERLTIDEAAMTAARLVDAQTEVQQALAAGDAAAAQRVFIEREIEAESAHAQVLTRLIDTRRAQAARVTREASELTRRNFLLLAAAVALVIAGAGGSGYLLLRRASRDEADLYRERELSEMALQSIGDGVITVDDQGRIDFMNPAAESLTGWSLEHARGRLLTEVYPVFDERTREPCLFQPWLNAPVATGAGADTPLRLAARDGREVSIRHLFAPVREIGGRMSGAIIVFHDDSNLRSLAQQLSWQASHDALTGLANRREFERRLAELLATAAQGGRAHALMYIDLDHFKAVNDLGGHAAGDELLRQLTAVMQAPIRASDMLARLGGDEFGALLESCQLEQALRIANQIRDAVNAFVFVWQGRQFKVGVTIGLLQVDAASGSVAQVISAADALCYQGKAEGRDRVHTRLPDADAGRRRSSDAQMISQISEAFDLGRFVLFSQPVAPLRVELAGSSHREVLVRMLDKQDRLVLPQVFMPAAERYELLGLIDRWVLRTLAAYLAERRARLTVRDEPPQRHSVNVSASSLQDQEFRAFVRSLIETHRIPPGQICLELTEVGAMTNLTRVSDAMHELRAAGCSFALDDFGVGLSSFSYLRYLPIDYLKIDAGFVRDLNDDPMDCAIVDSIARIGHVLGIHTVAQGVEDVVTTEKLQAMGIDYAQGNQFGAPRPLLDAPARLDLASAVPAAPLAPQTLNLQPASSLSAAS